MACNSKINTCGEKLYSPCVYYELELPSFSSLLDEQCVSIEDTTKDLYSLVGEIRDDMVFPELVGECINYSSLNPGIKEVILKFQEKICSQDETIASMASLIATMQQQITTLQNNTCP